jgi:Sir2 family protein
LPDDKISEFHGSYNSTVVMYGDSIGFDILHRTLKNMKQADMVIVMGTSLQVAPFYAVPNLLQKNGIRILVDINPNNTFRNSWSKSNRKLYEDEGFYSTPTTVSCIKIGKRAVTLRPLFGTRYNDRRKWREQYIYQADCDKWSLTLMEKLSEI